MPGLSLSVQRFRRGDHAVFCIDVEELLYICVQRDHVPVGRINTHTSQFYYTPGLSNLSKTLDINVY